MNAVAMAITACMTAPDAGPHLPLLQQLQQAVIGELQGGGKSQPGAKPAGPPGAPPGGAPAPGGVGGINGLMGQPPSGPAGAGGGQPMPGGGPSQSGISADDLRRAMAQQQG